MINIFKNLEPKMPLTQPPDFDENPFLKAFGNSIDICKGFYMLQIVDLPPQPLIAPKEASVTTTPSTTAALATTTSVVPATLPKGPVRIDVHSTQGNAPHGLANKSNVTSPIGTGIGL